MDGGGFMSPLQINRLQLPENRTAGKLWQCASPVERIMALYSGTREIEPICLDQMSIE
jgi:hypothetical protein